MSDCVGRIMKKRQKYSEGGKVANGGEDDLEELADGSPRNFDDLSLRDDLESTYDAKNSGDEDGDPEDEKRQSASVDRVMKKRASK